MSEEKTMIPEITEINPLTDDQLEKVSGGSYSVTGMPMRYKRCSADPTHTYSLLLDACPVCGAK